LGSILKMNGHSVWLSIANEQRQTEKGIPTYSQNPLARVEAIKPGNEAN
jgi:hypothetical protein